MKKIFAISVIFLICTVGKTATDSNNTIVPDSNNTAVPDTNTTAGYQERIRQLERTIESLQKRLDKIIAAHNKLKAENEQLRTLLPKEKPVADTKATVNFDPNNIIYRGRKRDVRWFDVVYKQFNDKIAFVNDKYTYIDSMPVQSFETLQGEVLQVLDNKSGEAIIQETGYVAPQRHNNSFRTGDGSDMYDAIQRNISNYESPKLTKLNKFFHIKGYKETLVDGQSFSCKAVDNGTFEYDDVLGAKRTIPSFIVYAPLTYKPLTKEQFADALNGGFVLKRKTTDGGKTIETPIP